MTKNLKVKILTVGLTATMGLTVAVNAAPIENLPSVTKEATQDIILELTTVDEEMVFSSISGKVKSIKDTDGKQEIQLEADNGKTCTILLDSNTFITDSENAIQTSDIKEKDLIKVYYINNLNKEENKDITASVLVKTIKDNPNSVFVGIFDETFLSLDKSLIINVSDETPIFDKEGNKFEGEITNKVLVVYSKIQTMSIPPQTPPEKIVVLEDMKTQLDTNKPSEPMEEEKPLPTPSRPEIEYDFNKISNAKLLVNNKAIENESAYVDENKIVMVPLRPIAEALGFDVKWDSATRQIRLGTGIVMTIDENSYTIGKMVPMKLDSAPVLRNGKTYVPIKFFEEVIETNLEYTNDTIIFTQND